MRLVAVKECKSWLKVHCTSEALLGYSVAAEMLAIQSCNLCAISKKSMHSFSFDDKI